jgi:hypothetical protein
MTGNGGKEVLHGGRGLVIAWHQPCCRQENAHSGANSAAAAQRQRAAVQFDEALRQGQPKPCALDLAIAAVIDLSEYLERGRNLLFSG